LNATSVLMCRVCTASYYKTHLMELHGFGCETVDIMQPADPNPGARPTDGEKPRKTALWLLSLIPVLMIVAALIFVLLIHRR
jgi:hypothetical protein